MAGEHLRMIWKPVGRMLAAAILVLPTATVIGQAGAPVQQAALAQKPFPGAIRLLLPPRIYAVPGIEMNVYFDNVCLTVNRANYVFDVVCDKGTQQAERWTITPTDQDVGQYPLALEVRDEANRIIARAESTLQIASKNAGAGLPVSFLMIGASETHAAVYPAHVLELCKPQGNPRLTLVGHVPHREQPTVRIEGYGGWTAKRFMNHFTAEKRPEVQGDREAWKAGGSPFLYSDGHGGFKADFGQYCRDFNQGHGPDFVTIILGGNDTFRCTDENIEASIDTMLEHYDGLIAMIHQVRNDTRIGAVLMYPPASSQDAFGANYQCSQTYWQCKRNLHRVCERILVHYGNRESEHIYLVPVKSNLDCDHNFPTLKRDGTRRPRPKACVSTMGSTRLPKAIVRSATRFTAG